MFIYLLLCWCGGAMGHLLKFKHFPSLLKENKTLKLLKFTLIHLQSYWGYLCDFISFMCVCLKKNAFILNLGRNSGDCRKVSGNIWDFMFINVGLQVQSPPPNPTRSSPRTPKGPTPAGATNNPLGKKCQNLTPTYVWLILTQLYCLNYFCN